MHHSRHSTGEESIAIIASSRLRTDKIRRTLSISPPVHLACMLRPDASGEDTQKPRNARDMCVSCHEITHAHSHRTSHNSRKPKQDCTGLDWTELHTEYSGVYPDRGIWICLESVFVQNPVGFVAIGSAALVEYQSFAVADDTLVPVLLIYLPVNGLVTARGFPKAPPRCSVRALAVTILLLLLSVEVLIQLVGVSGSDAASLGDSCIGGRASQSSGAPLDTRSRRLMSEDGLARTDQQTDRQTQTHAAGATENIHSLTHTSRGAELPLISQGSTCERSISRSTSEMSSGSYRLRSCLWRLTFLFRFVMSSAPVGRKCQPHGILLLALMGLMDGWLGSGNCNAPPIVLLP